MGSPVAAERRRLGGFALAWRYGLLALIVSLLTLVALQLLLGRQQARQQRNQLLLETSANLLLGSVALERFSPQALAELSGMRLAVGALPPPGRPARWSADDAASRQRMATTFRRGLCLRLHPCPPLRPALGEPRGLWVQMDSPLDQVWLFVPLPRPGLWPPDPGLLSLSLGIGGLGAGLLFQLLEVQRPLRQLQRAMGRVGLEGESGPVPWRGSGAVRQLSGRFNTMLERLASNELERRTMLAGIAHDLKAPLTRLRLRLQLAGAGSAAERPAGDMEAAVGDLDALERITGQFLLFAGAEAQEVPVQLPLQELLAETAAPLSGADLALDLQPLECWVRPISLSRAVANLLENAQQHGRPPLRLVLRPWHPDGDQGLPEGQSPQQGFDIQVWDGGSGIDPHDWPRALTPFLRLDPARRGAGHCGLGLAIAERIARDHGGRLERQEGPTGFGVALRGRGLPPA